MHGKGQLTFNDGKVYEGEFKNNNREGYGKFIFNGGRSYEGMWADGKQHGEGKLISIDGTETKGTWRYGTFINRRNSCLSPEDKQAIEA